MRNIVRLDIKQNYVVKGRQFEGYRKVAPISEIIEKLKSETIELFLYDVVATLFGSNSIIEQLSELLSTTFLPVTVGGGLDSRNKVDQSFRLGVDRIAINSANFVNIDLIKYIADNYGKQSAIGHIEAKKISGQWCAMYQNGREIGSKDLQRHVVNLQEAGVGEIILSSVDNDGMKNEFPMELVEYLNKVCEVPLILSGGITSFDNSMQFSHVPYVQGICISRAKLEEIC